MSIPVKFGTFMSKNAIRKKSQCKFPRFPIERHLHRDWKYQREFPGKVRTCFEYVFLRQSSVTVSVKTELIVGAALVVEWHYEHFCAEKKTLLLLVTLSTVQVQKFARKVLASIFWHQDGILLIDYLRKSQIIIAS